MATINISSAWSTLIIAMNRWEFMHIWTMIIHTCMNSHLFIAMINVDHTDDVLIVAMKDNWSCMKILFIASYHEPYHPTPNIEEKLVHNSQQARGGISCHHRMTDGLWSQYKVRRLSHDFAKHWGNNWPIWYVSNHDLKTSYTFLSSLFKRGLFMDYISPQSNIERISQYLSICKSVLVTNPSQTKT